MKSIGIDTVEIYRFENWKNYNIQQLNHIFTLKEIEYCLSLPLKSAERFAVRFAAKEAFFKALSSYLQTSISTFKIFKNAEIYKNKLMIPSMQVHDIKIKKILKKNKINIKISLTHTQNIATAIVIIS